MFINFTAKVAKFETNRYGNILVKILDFKDPKFLHEQVFSPNHFIFKDFSQTVIQRYEIVNLVLRHFYPDKTEISVQKIFSDTPKYQKNQIRDTFKVLTGHILNFDEIFNEIQLLLSYCSWHGCSNRPHLNSEELVKV